MERKIVYIVGAPRSGSKLLREVLNRHPQIVFGTNETEFLPFLLKYQKQHDLREPQAFARFVEYLELEDYCFYRRLDGFDAPDWPAWFKRLQSATAADAFPLFLEQELRYPPVSLILGDKSPSYARCLQQILELSPNSYAIHIVRDPRAQAGSEKRVFGKAAGVSARRWQRAVECVDAASISHPGRVQEVRYEDLVDNPEQALAGVCAMLDVAFDKSMTKIDRNLERYRREQQAPNIRRPPLRAYLDDLSMSEIREVSRVCEAGMKRYDYVQDAHLVAIDSPGLLRWLAFSSRIRFAVLTLFRHGPGTLFRKIRLKRARARIMSGRW